MQNQRYHILSRLDTGGMAEVFRAVAESTVGGLKRQVAIKRILPELTYNKNFVAMFLDEARLSLHLQHANIVHVTDIGKADSTAEMAESSYFLVMEYVEGINLKTLLAYQQNQGKILPVSDALYVALEICKGLAYAHDLVDPETSQPLGIVHRDVSPPNILLSKRGEVKLTDFGLAKAESQLQNTEPGVVKGKFSYLSPESAQGKLVDARTDLFAVGIVLYEMLTNERLFDGASDVKTLQLVQEAVVPPLRSKNPWIDEELEQIVHKILAKEPGQRYQSAAELVDVFAHYLFKHNLKVTNQDIEKLVAKCMQNTLHRNQPRLDQLSDALVQDEIMRFISLDELEAEGELPPTPPASSSLVDQHEWIDPRKWLMDDAETKFVSVPAQPSQAAAPPVPAVTVPLMPEYKPNAEVPASGERPTKKSLFTSRWWWLGLLVALLLGLGAAWYWMQFVKAKLT